MACLLDNHAKAWYIETVQNTSKPIKFSEHAKEQLRFRGASEPEAIEAIHKAEWQAAELKRTECRYEFIFNKIWNDKLYSRKQVRPIFIEENNKIVVITVYVYYS